MGFLNFLRKANETINDINDTLGTINDALGSNDEKPETQKRKDTGYDERMETKKGVEKAIPAPRLFDKDGREIRPDLHVR